MTRYTALNMYSILLDNKSFVLVLTHHVTIDGLLPWEFAPMEVQVFVACTLHAYPNSNFSLLFIV